jgi:hypothetical protein
VLSGTNWLPSGIPFDAVAVTIWLVILVVQDVRHRRLSHWLTTVPLVVIAIVALGTAVFNWLAEGWSPFVADPVALVLAFIAVLVSDTWAALVPAVSALALAWWQGTPAGQVAVTCWLIALALAKAGAWGAGDAKVLMILLALYPDVRLAIAVAAAILLIGLAMLVRRLGPAFPFLLLMTLRDGLAGRFPARTGETGVVVTGLMPVIAAGALVYVWGLYLLGG